MIVVNRHNIVHPSTGDVIIIITKRTRVTLTTCNNSHDPYINYKAEPAQPPREADFRAETVRKKYSVSFCKVKSGDYIYM